MAIKHSPRNGVLKATFQHSNTLTFQDGVGEALEQLACTVPDGLLMFLPSYGMMDKLAKRWKETGEPFESLTYTLPCPWQAVCFYAYPHASSLGCSRHFPSLRLSHQ